jgi:predicted CXXCH cytochrome family protein
MALLAGLPAEAATEPVLKVELGSQEAVPGQPIVLRVTVLVPTWLPEPPVFPSFEVPNVQVRLPERAAGPTSESVDGETWSGVTRAYRLYPMSVGRFRIPSLPLTVTFADPESQEPVSAALRTPEISFAGVAPDGAGDLDPFIAAQALSLEQAVAGDLEGLAPGDAVTRTITARITGTSPVFLPPLSAALDTGGLAAYPKEPVVSETLDRGRLSGERIEAVTYVASAGGAFQLPPVRLDWFNLNTGRVETAEIDGLEIVVSGDVAASSDERAARWPALLAALALLVLAAIAWAAWRLAPLVGAWRQRRRVAWQASERFACQAVRSALRARDLAAALSAKTVWDTRLPPTAQRAETALDGAFVRLSAARYGRTPGTPDAADWAAAEAALAQARDARMAASRLGCGAAPSLNPPRSALRPAGRALLVVLALSGVSAASAAPDYVGTASCASCHADEVAAWQGSHHALAWTLPDETTVLGDFDDASFEHRGVVTRFSRDGAAFVVETDAADGTIQRFEVVGVAGIAPLQQYLLETEPGREQSLDIVWDVEEERWYHLYPDQELQPGDGMHWTGPFKSWNARCAECHATGYERNYDLEARRYQSRQAERGVGCEACHGPGEAHLAWAADPENAGLDRWPGLTDQGFTIDFSPAAPTAEIEQCAACHSRREPFLDGNPLPGTAFDDAYRLSLLREGLYHPDGFILDEVYVYGSFLQSKMHAQGVRCSDCHEPHSAELRAEGNAVCTQCHSPAGNERFPTLRPADFDSPEHHFHEAGTEGAACVSCHMPDRPYMGIDWRRDHSFRIPRPDLSLKTGAPNACTDCHTDRGDEWAAAAVSEWFPDTDRTATHFSETFHAARSDPAGSAAALLTLAHDDALPGIVRATALDLLNGVADETIAADSVDLLADPDPLVRAAAVELQRGAAPMDRVQRLVPLLTDERRSVRMAAARGFLGAPIARLPDAIEQDWRAAIDEWRDSLAAKADFPEAHLAIGGAALVMRNMDAAEAAFREAVLLDPQQVAAWRMIARIRAAVGDRDGAVQALDDGLAANPGNGMLAAMRGEL